MTVAQVQSIFDAMNSYVTVELVNGRFYLSWDFVGKQRRRWDAPEGSSFPTWSRKAPWCGTRSMCYGLLVRAIQGKPIVPYGTWINLVTGPCKLCGGNPEPLKAALDAAGWPHEVPCILCGKMLTRTGDWWTVGEGRKRKSGPSCSMADCREKK